MTDSYVYDAFGNLRDRLGTTVNHYLYTGEQYDPDAGLYYLRARYYSPGNGRFASQDSWQGRISDPVTLHKYLYANGNPVNRIDPSGLSSVAEMNTGIRILEDIMNKIYVFNRYMTYVEKAQGVADVFNLLRQINRYLLSDDLTNLTRGISGMVGTKNVSPDFERVFDRGFWRGAIMSFTTKAPNIGWKVILKWSKQGFKEVRDFVNNRDSKIAIYAPTPPREFRLPRIPVNTGLKISDGRRDYPVVLIFGSSKKRGGRITGGGFFRKGDTDNQLFRMDWHNPDDHRDPITGKLKPGKKDFDIFEDPPYHYHINK